MNALPGGVFVGRQREIQDLKAAMEDALAGHGRIVMLVGEPGIGKTRTAQELAAYARYREAQVLWGRCYENPGAPPYWPWVQIVRAYLRERDAETLYEEMGAGAANIAEIVPEVRELLPDLQHPTTLEHPEQARFRLFDSITTFFKGASRRQPMVLFLDNLHWADKPSLLLLEFLAQEMAGSRLLVIGTYRDIELSRRHPLTETLAELTRERLFQRVPLRGLSLEEVGHFMEVSAGITPPKGLVVAIHSQTEGNPLFVTQVVRLLVDEGVLSQAGLQPNRPISVSIPEGIKEVIGRRLNRLSESCTQTLTIASVIGREFSLNELERLIDHMSEDRLLETLEEAVATRVIEELPQAGDRYQFSHVLIRETIYEELTAARRARLHQRIGENLEDLYRGNLEPYLARLAYHFFEAIAIGNADKAVDYATRTAQRDMALLAYEEAARYYEMAQQALLRKESIDEPRLCRLLLDLGDAQKKAGDSERAIEAFQQAADLARKLGSPDELAQAATGFEDASWRPGFFGGPAVRLLEEALKALPEGESILKARVLASLVRALYFSGLPDRASVLTQQAVEMARRLGDPVTLVDTLNITGFSNRWPGTLEKRLAFAAEALKVAETAGHNNISMDIYAWHLFDLLEVGDSQGVREGLEGYQRLVELIRQPFYLCVVVSYRSALAIGEGRFEEAEQLAKQALVICQRLKGQDPSGIFGMKMFTIRKEQGRLPEVAPALRTFIQQRSASGAWRPGLALIYSELGMEPEARAELEHLAASDFAAIPQDALQVVCLVYLAEVCAFLSNRDRAAVLYRLLLPWDGHNVVVGGGIAYYGSAARYLGMLATIMSRWEEADRHFQQALEMDARMGARTWLAHSQHEYAKMLLARDQPGDRETAPSLFSQALATARELGMTSLEQRIVALQEETTLVGATRRIAPAYPDGLSEREAEVLRLLAAGKGNREVAEVLFISVNTVARHVANIFNKTGAANRTEAAAYAIRHGIVEK